MQIDYLYSATIVNVVDGDTVDARVDLGFNVSIDVRFRLVGVNTMETRDKDPIKKALALKAKEYLKELILNKEVVLKSHKTDKYGRWLAEIFYDGNSVNGRLIAEGLGVMYNGGARE
jgi:micrococcal nuclease